MFAAEVLVGIGPHTSGRAGPDATGAEGASQVASRPVPVLVALTLHDDAERWRALGFSVQADGACQVGAVRLAIVPTPEGSRTGLTGWTFEGTAEVDVVDGIPTHVAPAGAPPPAGSPPASWSGSRTGATGRPRQASGSTRS